MFEKLFSHKKANLVVSDDWPFQSPRNEAVITVKQIISGDLPILLVAHDESDGGWQFLTGSEFEMSQAAIVALEEIVRIDPSVQELANLPEGWEAKREEKGLPWLRGKSQNEDAA